MKIMDCTLRDGANVVGDGFSRELTELILKGLTDCHIPIIEFGNAKGIGAYEVANATNALSDAEYLETVQPFLNKAEFGMFLNASRFSKKYVDQGHDAGLHFFRIGISAGDSAVSKPAIEYVKTKGIKAYYAEMKAYILSPIELAAEAKELERLGIDEITIMDSAGTMTPRDTHNYVCALKDSVSIPIGFHSHNNLYLAIANCNEAASSGADIIDCGLLGMARSAGNIATEAAIANLMRIGIDVGIDIFPLLNFLDNELIPAMKSYNYSPAVMPLDLVLGFSGCHSSFIKTFRKIALEEGVNLYKLIVAVSAINRKNPSDSLIHEVAHKLKATIS